MWPALTCELCGRRFRGSLAKFHRHRQTHREQNAGIGFLSCLACGFETDDAAELSEHACGRGEAPAEPAEDLYWYCQSWQRAGPPVWAAAAASAPATAAADARDIARRDMDHAKRTHEIERVNQMEVTAMQLEQLAAARTPAPRRQASVIEQPEMKPFKVSLPSSQSQSQSQYSQVHKFCHK